MSDEGGGKRPKLEGGASSHLPPVGHHSGQILSHLLARSCPVPGALDKPRRRLLAGQSGADRADFVQKRKDLGSRGCVLALRRGHLVHSLAEAAAGRRSPLVCRGQLAR